MTQEQQERKVETRTTVKRIFAFTIGWTAGAILAVLVATGVYAQDQTIPRVSQTA